MKIHLFNLKAHDGSRQFARIPQMLSWQDLHDQLQKVPGVVISGLAIGDAAQAWIDFSYRGHSFKINNQFGDYGFFVQDATCPDEILVEVLNHCENKPL